MDHRTNKLMKPQRYRDGPTYRQARVDRTQELEKQPLVIRPQTAGGNMKYQWVGRYGPPREMVNLTQHSLVPPDEPIRRGSSPHIYQDTPTQDVSRSTTNCMSSLCAPPESPVPPCIQKPRAATVGARSFTSGQSRPNNAPDPLRLIPIGEPVNAPLSVARGWNVAMSNTGPDAGRGIADSVQQDRQRSRSDVTRPFRNPRLTPEESIQEDVQSITPETNWRKSIRNMGSMEKLKAFRHNGISALTGKTSEKSRRKSHNVLRTTQTETAVIDFASRQRKDSLVDSRLLAQLPRQSGPDPEEHTRASKAPLLDVNVVRQRARTTTSLLETTDKGGFRETMATISEIDDLCAKQAKLYTSLRRQRYELQENIRSDIEAINSPSRGNLQGRHQSAMAVNAEMDRLVSVMLYEQRRQAALVQSLLSQLDATAEKANLGRAADGEGVIESMEAAAGLPASSAMTHRSLPNDTRSKHTRRETKRGRFDESRQAMTFSTVMDFLEEPIGDE